MKNCWNCENQIPKNARVCKFCGSVQMCAPVDELTCKEKENNAGKDEKQS